MRLSAAIFVSACILWCGEAAFAQTQTFVLGNSPNVQIPADQKIMFDAASAFMHRDYSSADSLYSQALALNPGNLDAYLQRAAVRRERGDTQGMQADAQMAINLANHGLEQNPRNPTLYYDRGMGYRLLKEFDKAKADITKGMRIGGKKNWETDLKAIEMERKEVD